MKVNIIYSCEPAFAFNWFKVHDWQDAHKNFTMYFNAKATPTMKTYLDVSDFTVFVSSYAKQIKPLINA